MESLLTVVVVSEAVAAVLVWKLWRSTDLLFMKIALSVLAIIPVIGPIAVLWIARFPAPAATSLQNEPPATFTGRYFSRWGPIVSEKDPVRRYRLWRDELEHDRTDEP